MRMSTRRSQLTWTVPQVATSVPSGRGQAWAPPWVQLRRSEKESASESHAASATAASATASADPRR
jgi:hypothetical protein